MPYYCRVAKIRYTHEDVHPESWGKLAISMFLGPFKSI